MARITQTKIAHIRHVMDIIDFENLSRADTIVKDFVYYGVQDMIDQLCMPETDEAIMLVKELNAKMDKKYEWDKSYTEPIDSPIQGSL